jgi:hypothetical protein
MMGRRFWLSTLILCVFVLTLVWQAGRFTALKEKADELDNQQEKWSAENRKLEADISLLMSRQRTADMASSLGLIKIDPADRLRIVVIPTAQDTTTGNPISAADPQTQLSSKTKSATQGPGGGNG